MNRGGMACAAVALGVSAALAQSPIPVGNFAVTVKKGPFGDGSTAIATTGDAYHAIGLPASKTSFRPLWFPMPAR